MVPEHPAFAEVKITAAAVALSNVPQLFVTAQAYVSPGAELLISVPTEFFAIIENETDELGGSVIDPVPKASIEANVVSAGTGVGVGVAAAVVPVVPVVPVVADAGFAQAAE